jgi:hypothetical protein
MGLGLFCFHLARRLVQKLMRFGDERKEQRISRSLGSTSTGSEVMSAAAGGGKGAVGSGAGGEAGTVRGGIIGRRDEWGLRLRTKRKNKKVKQSRLLGGGRNKPRSHKCKFDYRRSLP